MCVYTSEQIDIRSLVIVITYFFFETRERRYISMELCTWWKIDH